jgi:plastocyanin
VPETQKLTVIIKDFAFEPNVITLKKGVPVELTLINQGLRHHDFTVQGDWSFKSDVLDSGDTKVLTFTPDIAGTFQLFCSQVGHKAAGMVAQVVVTD